MLTTEAATAVLADREGLLSAAAKAPADFALRYHCHCFFIENRLPF